MTIILRFASSAQATGLTASAFERSSAGVGLFFNFRESANVCARWVREQGRAARR